MLARICCSLLIVVALLTTGCSSPSSSSSDTENQPSVTTMMKSLSGAIPGRVINGQVAGKSTGATTLRLAFEDKDDKSDKSAKVTLHRPVLEKHLVLTRFVIENTGDTPLPVSVEVTVVGSDSEQYQPSSEKTKDCKPPTDDVVAPGDKMSLCESFDMPEDVELKTVRMKFDSASMPLAWDSESMQAASDD